MTSDQRGRNAPPRSCVLALVLLAVACDGEPIEPIEPPPVGK